MRHLGHPPQARRQWAKWEAAYNRVRPHESLDLMTPLEHVKVHPPSEACSDM
ncbi:MAG: integrase core domain-containing protein [Gammaproteobacteria bacterium]|nr:integrase core domain-containing protein [Gammaproteobacteria bacterium]